MAIEHRIGSLFDSNDIQALAHGCNTLGVFGAGIAVHFKHHFPSMYLEYRGRCMEQKYVPGDLMVWENITEERNIVVYNLMTQGCMRDGRYPGSGIIQLATLGAIKASVDKMLEDAKQRQITRIGLPLLAAGLGGLLWRDVEQVLILSCKETYPEVTLVVHSLK